MYDRLMSIDSRDAVRRGHRGLMKYRWIVSRMMTVAAGGFLAASVNAAEASERNLATNLLAELIVWVGDSQPVPHPRIPHRLNMTMPSPAALARDQVRQAIPALLRAAGGRDRSEASQELSDLTAVPSLKRATSSAMDAASLGEVDATDPLPVVGPLLEQAVAMQALRRTQEAVGLLLEARARVTERLARVDGDIAAMLLKSVAGKLAELGWNDEALRTAVQIPVPSLRTQTLEELAAMCVRSKDVAGALRVAFAGMEIDPSAYLGPSLRGAAPVVAAVAMADAGDADAALQFVEDFLKILGRQAETEEQRTALLEQGDGAREALVIGLMQLGTSYEFMGYTDPGHLAKMIHLADRIDSRNVRQWVDLARLRNHVWDEVRAGRSIRLEDIDRSNQRALEEAGMWARTLLEAGRVDDALRVALWVNTEDMREVFASAMRRALLEHQLDRACNLVREVRDAGDSVWFNHPGTMSVVVDLAEELVRAGRSAEASGILVPSMARLNRSSGLDEGEGAAVRVRGMLLEVDLGRIREAFGLLDSGRGAVVESGAVLMGRRLVQRLGVEEAAMWMARELENSEKRHGVKLGIVEAILTPEMADPMSR